MKKKLECGRPLQDQGTPSSDAKLERWKTRLREYLEANSLKFSEPRWKIAKLILSTPGHFSAQDIVKKVSGLYPDMGSATVYRNIKVLSDAKILRETLVDASGKVVYESFDEEHHDHIVCVDCGEIFEFHDEDIEQRQVALMKKRGFEEVSHRHVLYAHCSYLTKKR